MRDLGGQEVPVLARKTTRAKWQPKPDLAEGEIAADAVTVDSRTTGNTLSFWRCLSAEADVGLATKDTPGDTPVVSLREHHVDLEKLDLVRLGVVAGMVASAHRSDAVLTMTKKEVISLVAQAVRGTVVSLVELKGAMKVKVEAQLKEGE
jgi:hypothetical protein